MWDLKTKQDALPVIVEIVLCGTVDEAYARTWATYQDLVNTFSGNSSEQACTLHSGLP